MATINIGSIKFKWQGAYNGATAYTVDDVVSYNGSSYICIANSTGNLPTNTSYFEQMSQKGADGTNGINGTDLTSTLTTQGDLVYRDGSGLQRLGAGTNGQVLTTGGAGANPSWSTVSSDFVKILTTNYTAGSSNTVDIDDVFSSTYKYYKVEIINLIPDNSTSAEYYMYLKNSSGPLTSNYYHWMNGAQIQSGSGSYGDALQWNGSQINMGQYGGNPINSGISKGGVSQTWTIQQPYDNTVPTNMFGHSLYRNWDSTRFVPAQHIVQHFNNGANETVTGFRLYVNNGNIARVYVSVYGLKD